MMDDAPTDHATRLAHAERLLRVSIPLLRDGIPAPGLAAVIESHFGATDYPIDHDSLARELLTSSLIEYRRQP